MKQPFAIVMQQTEEYYNVNSQNSILLITLSLCGSKVNGYKRHKSAANQGLLAKGGEEVSMDGHGEYGGQRVLPEQLTVTTLCPNSAALVHISTLLSRYITKPFLINARREQIHRSWYSIRPQSREIGLPLSTKHILETNLY